MNKKFLLFLLVAIFAIGVFTYRQSPPRVQNIQAPSPSSENNTNTDSVKEAVLSALSQKYQLDPVNLVVEVTREEGGFAKGSLSYTGQMGGALWFAAKTGQGWELASDGQGPMSCDIASRYNFPADFVPSCLDADSTLVNR